MNRQRLRSRIDDEIRVVDRAASTERPRKSLGRRPGGARTRESILNAAEEVFALHGFAGASMREIAGKAGVHQALLHHYFKTKQRMFQEVFLRRGQELARRRLELLDELENRARAPRVEEIVRAFLVPAYDLKRSGGPGGVAFLQLQARLHTEVNAITLEMRTAVYDRALRRYARALARRLPKLDVATIYWRMIFAVGSYYFTISDHHRLDAISGGACNSKDLDDSLRQLVNFIVGGFKEGTRPAGRRTL